MLRVMSRSEASGHLVGSPVFKTGGRRSASSAGSIPVRLRQLGNSAPVGERPASLAVNSKIRPGRDGTLMARQVIGQPPSAPRESGVAITTPRRESPDSAGTRRENRLAALRGHPGEGPDPTDMRESVSRYARLAAASAVSLLLVTGCSAGGQRYHDKLTCETFLSDYGAGPVRVEPLRKTRRRCGKFSRVGRRR